MSLHATTKLERLIAAERCIHDAQAELSDVMSDADYPLDEAAAAVHDLIRRIAATYGDDHFPPRSAESVLADHNYPPLEPQVTAADVTLGCDAVVTLRDAVGRAAE